MRWFLNQLLRERHAELFRTGPDRFYVLPGEDAGRVRALLRNFEAVQRNSNLLKDSRTTRAGIAPLGDSDDEVIFWKRNNSKGFAFTLRYLFRPARVFRAAAAAFRLEELGVETPGVLAVGERRNGLVLQYGYLLTRSYHDMHSLQSLFRQAPDPEKLLDPFFASAGKMAALLHRHGLLHGDLKISNFYYRGSWCGCPRCGIWDLDSVRRCPSGPTLRMRAKELSRVISSILIQCDANTSADKRFFCPEALSERLLAGYAASSAGSAEIPSAGEVAAIARERWLREPGLVHTENIRHG